MTGPIDREDILHPTKETKPANDHNRDNESRPASRHQRLLGSGKPASGKCEVQWRTRNYDQAFEQAYQLAKRINTRVDQTADERFIAAKGQFYACYQELPAQRN